MMRHVSCQPLDHTERTAHINNQKLYTTNGTEIALLGEAEFTLMLADYEVTAAVVVSKEVDDLILA